VDPDPRHDRRLSFVGGRNDHLVGARVADRCHEGHDTVHRPQGSVESQLPDQRAARQARHGRQLPRGSEDADGDRQVVPGAVLRQVGRRQVDRDAARRRLEATVAERTSDSLAGLLHLAAGKAHDRQRGQTERHVHLNADRDAVDAEQGRGMCLGEHHCSRGASE
jgi:hypothetical protein